MSNTDLPEIEIFKPGTFTSVQGDRLSFSAADVAELRDTYNAARNPAPLVVGHPQLDDPAYGWAGGLRINDAGVLVATPSQVEPAFAELVRAGRFKRVSAEIYPRDHAYNPTPGKLHLKHIGFLGAAAPAVKGLKPVAFNEGRAGCMTFENPLKETDMSGSSDETEGDKVAHAFAEREAGLASREADLAAREEKLRIDRETADKAAAAARHDGHVSFAEAQCAAGRLAPARKDELVFVFDALSAVPGTMAFGEGDAARSPVAVLQAMIAEAPPLLSFGMVADVEPRAPSAVMSFAMPSGHAADPAALEVHTKALDLMRAEPGLSYIAAAQRAAAA